MSETITRTISGVVFIALLIGATLYSQLSFEILFSFFLLTASYEFSKLINLPKTVTVGFSLLVIALLFWNKEIFPSISIAIYAIAVLLALMLELFTTKKPNRSVIIKVVIFLGYIIAPFITLLFLPINQGQYTPQIIIGMFILIWTNDTFAYIVGKKFGKNKLFERISPKKTIEGFLGGIVFCIIAGIILSQYFTFFSIKIWISSAIFVGIFGTVGDLIESHFKREAGVKDSGTIMPGHGGILDRLDSVIFVAPFLYIIFQIL
ncbi:phosphatidate cytidylyltransferase [Myroides injenensis]|uniref:phosphatidate cytidylyltransferase n=1 Tax=Myroides injenensis TaxID=1183151 RepID=UPI000288C78C|nr:phosphatidate cytidylyltransferase [Myroides injenensis]